MMVGEGVDDDEHHPVDEWPPPGPALELANKDGTSSRLLFLTVQYVNEESGVNYSTGLEHRVGVVSPLDPNMGCVDSYSPVYRPSSPLIPSTVSPSSSFLNPTSPDGGPDSGMIVLSEPCEFTQTDNFVVTNSRLFSHTPAPDDSKQLLLLSTNSTNPADLVVAENSDIENQRVELLLSNGTIAYGIVESTDSTGARVIQIPREYLVTTPSQGPDTSPIASNNVPTQINSIQDENSHLRALYNTLKEQGLIIEQGELRLEPHLVDPQLPDINTSQQLPEMNTSQQLPDINTSQQLPDINTSQQLPDINTSQQLPDINTSLLEQVRLPELQSAAGVYANMPPQKRFWCEECNVLLEKDCREHQVERKISDKAVPSRARATLPASYLTINQVSEDSEECGVFARKNIPKRTQFGPIEGVILKPGEVQDGTPRLVLTIETESGEMNTLDVSNEHMSNWMRFVRMATAERPPNVLLSQLGASLFFTTTHLINARQELLVWYSPAYASRRGLPPNPPSPEWLCSSCGEKLKTADQLFKHSQMHRPPMKKEENLTVNTLRRKNQAVVACMKKDVNKHNVPKPKQQFECIICKKVFMQEFGLKRHILLLHTRENKYHCKICHLGFSHSFNRLRHMRRVHPKHKDVVPAKHSGRYESWSCSYCELTFNSAYILNLHMLVHAANNIEESDEFIIPDDIEEVFQKPQDLVACPQCSQKFTSKMGLARHVAEHSSKDKGNRKHYHCHVCSRNFFSFARYKSHCKTHGDEEKKPLQCNTCKKRFLNNSALAVHSKIHEFCVQWDCPMCKQQFNTLFSLKSHIHSHAVKGFYHCPHCEKVFEEYSGIRKHIRTFHVDLKHNCNNCDKAFPTQDKLRMHLLKHSDHKEFLCADCGKQFKRKDKLSEHMKRIHLNKEAKHRNTKTTSTALLDQKQLNKLSLVVNTATDYERYIYKCHSCMLGFKRRGMLVNHLYNRHPDITPDSVPELNLPILKTTRDYYCQYCDKIYKSSSKRKAHILKNHPGLDLPMSNRQKGGIPEIPGLLNPTFSQTVGSITTDPQSCQWCHKQYASKAKLLQHQRKKHSTLFTEATKQQTPVASRPLKNLAPEQNIEKGMKFQRTVRTIRMEDIINSSNSVPVTLSHPSHSNLQGETPTDHVKVRFIYSIVLRDAVPEDSEDHQNGGYYKQQQLCTCHTPTCKNTK